MPSKESLKRRIQLQNEVISKQLDTIDVLKRIIDKIYPKQSESFQDKKDIKPDIFKNCQFMDRIIVPETQKDFCKHLTTVPSDLLENHPQITVCKLEDVDNGR